jgi:hypothetical protein
MMMRVADSAPRKRRSRKPGGVRGKAEYFEYADYNCVTCGKLRNSGPRIELAAGFMQRQGAPRDDTRVALSDRRSRDLDLFLGLMFHPDESESAPEPRRHYLGVDIDLRPISQGQGEIRFCNFTCLRRWFKILIDRMENESRLQPGETAQVYRSFRLPEQPPKTIRLKLGQTKTEGPKNKPATKTKSKKSAQRKNA